MNKNISNSYRRMIRIVVTILITYHLSIITSMAQCGIENTAFQAGEKLDYDLHFNW